MSCGKPAVCRASKVGASSSKSATKSTRVKKNIVVHEGLFKPHCSVFAGDYGYGEYLNQSIVWEKYMIMLNNPTEKNCIDALNKDGTLLMFIENQTNKMCMVALNQNLLAFRYIENKTTKICNQAIQIDPYLLKYVENQTSPLCQLAVSIDGMTLSVVKNQTIKVCVIAVMQNILALNYVKPELVGYVRSELGI